MSPSSSSRRPCPKICWTIAAETPRPASEAKCCALIGNVWSAGWLTRLGRVIESSGWKVNCYGHDSAGNGEKPGFVKKGFVSEDGAGERIGRSAFCHLPHGHRGCRGR